MMKPYDLVYMAISRNFSSLSKYPAPTTFLAKSLNTLGASISWWRAPSRHETIRWVAVLEKDGKVFTVFHRATHWDTNYVVVNHQTETYIRVHLSSTPAAIIDIALDPKNAPKWIGWEPKVRGNRSGATRCKADAEIVAKTITKCFLEE
jgi:hypothetical protein